MKSTFSGLQALAFLIFALMPAMALAQSGSTTNPYSWQSTTISGDESDGASSLNWLPGIATGWVNVQYQMYTVPDSLVITYDGKTVYSTGGYVSGTGNITTQFGTSSSPITSLFNVLVNGAGALPGTAWTYTITPTQKPTLTSLAIEGPTALQLPGTDGIFKAIAFYSDGSKHPVIASWSTSSASIVPNNADQSVKVQVSNTATSGNATLTANFTDSGITKTASITISVSVASISGNGDASAKRSNVDDSGNIQTDGDPVDVAGGAEKSSVTLISVSGLRDLSFSISYNSLLVNQNTVLGYGWTHTYAATVSESFDYSTVTITWSPSLYHVYTLVQSPQGSYYRCADEAAQYDTLVKNADGSFSLKTQDGTIYSFDTSKRLSVIKNKSGQALVINYLYSNPSYIDYIIEPVSGARLTFSYGSYPQYLTKITDDLGRTVKLAYDASGMLTQWTDVNGHTTTYTYDSNRHILTTTAPDGKVVLTNTYDTKGRVTTQDDGVSTNKLFQFSYDETTTPGQIITKVVDRTGGTKTYVHDAHYHLLSVTDQLGNKTTYAYDATGNRTSVTDSLGRVTSYTYDSSGNILTVTDPAGNITKFTYDANNNVLSTTNPAGKTATLTYDANNNPLTSTDYSGNTTTRTFDSNSELLTVKTPIGNTTKYSYTNGRLVSTIDPLGNKASFTYDVAGRLTSVTDPAGGINSYTYTASGKLLTKTDPLGNKTTNTYDVRDRLSSVKDPLGNTTIFAYDANSNLVSRTDALGQTTTYAYDGEDRLTTTTDPLAHTTTLAYDSAGRLVSTTDATGNVSKFEYDAVGNRTASYDALGNKILTTAYDNRDLPTSLTDALGNSTTQAYDVLGRLTSRTDPLGLKTSLAYDDLSHLIQSTNPAGQSSKQTFDTDGNRSGLSDPLSNGLAFTYDAAGRLTKMKSSGGRTLSYTFDGRGLATGITKPSSANSTLTYDAAGRLAKLVDPVGTINFNYDSSGRLTTVKEGSKTISRSYDVINRLVSFTDSAGNQIKYTYDAAGNLATLTYPDSKVVTYAYDNANRLVKVTDWASRVTQYTYDANGRLTTTLRPNGTQQTLTYDKAGRLTSAVDLAADKTTVIVKYTSTYDMDGRLISENRTPAAPAFAASSVRYAYGADNQLSRYSGQTVLHDANGNLLSAPISGVLSSLAYDSRDRLLTAGGLTYGYDAENRRVSTTSTAGTTTYVYDPNAQLSRLLMSVSTSGSITKYVYGLGPIYQETDGTTVRYLHDDPRGNTVALSGGTGAVIGRIEYGPFGEIISQTDDTATILLYCGQYGVQTDANGLLNMRARYYSPTLGRFVQQDTLTGNISADGLNRYVYALSNPFLYNDPLGLCANCNNGNDFWAGFKNGFNLKNFLIGAGVGLGVGAIEIISGGTATPLLLWGGGILATAGAINAGTNIANSDNPWYTAGQYTGGFTSSALGGGVANYGLSLGIGSLAADTGISEAQSSFSLSPKIVNQMDARGWNSAIIDDTITNPKSISPALNKATGGDATAYFRPDGSYVVRDNATGRIIQISNRNDPNWIPDPTIKSPPSKP